MVMKTELERIDGRRRKRGRPQRPSTVSNRFILTLDSFWFCIFRITYSSPLFPFPSTGGHHASALAAPVVLTAPDRAVLMGADDDWRPWGELTAHKGHISPHRCRGRDGESERKEEEWRQVDERREGGKKKTPEKEHEWRQTVARKDVKCQKAVGTTVKGDKERKDWIRE